MKNFIASIVIGLLALEARAALPQPDLIARIHFAGAQKISGDPQVHAFTNEFTSAEALVLRAQTATKLANWLAGWLQTNLDTTVPDGAAKLRPLFDDLQQAEFFVDARAAAGGKPEVAIAIQLAPARAELWQAGLKPFFPAATFKTANDWLIFDSLPGPLGDRLAQKISTPPAAWLDLDINWPRLAQWYPVLKELGLPETQFTLTAPDDNFHLDGKFLFPENLALNLEPWRVPTNTVHQPFDSFTAIRGFSSWLPAQPWAWMQSLELTPTPNQLFIWSLPGPPFQTFAAIPVPDATHALAQVYAKLAQYCDAANARNEFFQTTTPTLTNREINFSGTPFISPHLRAVTEPSGQFLLGELFPNTPKSRPLPPELFSRLAANNLVYYHWEITATRLPELLQLTQLGLMLTHHKQLEGESAAFKWLQRAGGNLTAPPMSAGGAAKPGAWGNTRTEILQTGPAEFTFTRQAPGILTASELFELADWLEATNFPGCDLRLPARSPHFKQMHAIPTPPGH